MVSLTLFCPQAFAKSHGFAPPPGGLSNTSATIDSAIAATVGPRALEKIATAVKQFREFIIEKSGTPLSTITGLPDVSLWGQERYDYHVFLLAHYVCHVNTTHKQVSTSVGYARAVSKHWEVTYRHVLWTEKMFDEVVPMLKGLKNLNMAVSKVRDGLTGADICILAKALRARVTRGECARPSKAGLYMYDERLVESIIASWHFCYQECFRFGDATSPDNTPFNPKFRLTRDDIRYSKPVKGHKQTITVPAPKMKVTNRHTGFAIVGEIDDDAPINWAASVDRMLVLDPSPTDKATAAVTPLFRNVLNVSLGAGGGLPFTGRWMRALIRSLVDECEVHFGPRVSADFGVHSFRIGKLNDMLQAGATMFQVSTMGRWVSDAVLRYHRMTQEASTALHNRAVDCSLVGADAEGFVGFARPRTLAQQAALSDALLATAPNRRTARRHVPAPNKKQRSMLSTSGRQATLDAWAGRS